MPTPSIILPKPLVMISQGNSYAGGSNDGTGINFGNIVLTHDLCDWYSVGDNVFYITEGQTLVSFSDTQYVIVEEGKILGNEGNSPP